MSPSWMLKRSNRFGSSAKSWRMWTSRIFSWCRARAFHAGDCVSTLIVGSFREDDSPRHRVHRQRARRSCTFELAMAQKRMLVDRVLVVAWRAPEEEDIREISREVEEQHAALGRPLLYYSVIGHRGIPQGTVRQMILEFYKTILAQCDSMHVVIE